MQNRKRTSRLLSLTLSLALVLALLPAPAGAAGQQPPAPLESVTSDWSGALKLDFGYQHSDWVEKITYLSVDTMPYQKVTSTFQLQSNTYVLQPNDGRIVLPTNLSGTVKCHIRSQGYEDLNLSLDTQKRTVSVIPAAQPDPAAPAAGEPLNGISAELRHEMSVYLKLTLSGVQGYADTITAVRRMAAGGEDAELRRVTYKAALNGPAYFLDAGQSAVYFDAMNPILRSGDILVISSSRYQDLRLKITRAGSDYQVQELHEEQPQPGDGLTLQVRLVGAFEPALAGQTGYDAISGATSSVTMNQNSSVEVQCALVRDGTTPADSDWQPLHKSGLTVNAAHTRVDIKPQGSGMQGIYSTLDSSLILNGTPARKGEYQVTVTLEDDQGRRAVSSPLPFVVYGGDEKLAEQLTLEHAKQVQDGKYLYDMIPWAIRDFGGERETVTVPAQIKAWFGSHTSGTYGKLGYPVDNGAEPTQTLLIPAGCDLTLVNMDLLSSVRLVVQEGGKLTLQDSAVQGVVEVEKGGTFSMNYDGYHKKFLTGASINGQLRLNSGAVLENAAIYSNTNFIANGTQVRKNTQPVVAVLGDVTFKGQVFLKGDEAPTGTDPKTGKSYAGQTGLSVTGTLTLADGALLAVYGGGMQAATSVGGAAILLDRGTITGGGTLLAVGGDGTFDRGGDAVSGSGSISAAKAYLQGGASAFPKSADITGGLAAAEGVNAPNAVKSSGVTFRSQQEHPSIPRWAGASAAPGQADAQQLIAYVTERASATPTIPAIPAIRRPSPSLPKTSENSLHTVTVASSDHGSVTPSSSRAKMGDNLLLTIRPDQGYGLERLTVTGQNGRAVKVTRTASGQYTFVMPDVAVRIQASFEKAAAPEDLDSEAPAAAAVSPGVPFRDVSPNDDYYAAVQWAVGRNVTQGTTAYTFSPAAQCTRAQVVTFLWRAAGAPAPRNRSVPFQDVKPGDFSYDAVCWAVEQGITTGTGASTFSPGLTVNRAQAVALLHRAAGSPSAQGAAAFTDVERGSYYADAAQWASARGITRGTGGNRFSPGEDCTRSQIVSLLYRGVQQNAFPW